MNVLFISDRQALPTFGGIERVINNLARQFTLDNHNCYHAFFSLIDAKRLPNPIFKGEFFLTDNLQVDLESIVVSNKIDFVINNCIVKRHIKDIMPELQTLKSRTPNTKYCFLYHNSCVGAEMLHCSYGFYLKRFFAKSWSKSEVLVDFLKAIFFDMFPQVVKHYFQKKYRRISDNEPNLVLLSERYKRNFANIAGLKDIPSQWHAIGNSLCFDIQEDVDIETKDKVVLLVARIEEDHKRISKALEIWGAVQKKLFMNGKADWRFVIVGDGKDRTIYEDIVKRQHISDVSFVGWQDSLPYYLMSSIFIMVSVTEGFPMTLMEAKQCGCVPIAFDSFEAVHDVIENGVDGYIVKNNDNDRYIDCLISLMESDCLRSNMAKNGIESAQKFSVDKIAQEWYDYYKRL